MNQGNKRLQKVTIKLTTTSVSLKNNYFKLFFSDYVALLFAFSTTLY